MLITEFEALTGIYPSAETYCEIEKQYVNFHGNKQEFCKAYVENRDGLATKIQTLANMAACRREKEKNQEIGNLQSIIQKLKEKIGRLDAKLGWMPYDGNTVMSDDEYSNLAKTGQVMTKEDALDFLNREFGFAKEAVQLSFAVPYLEKDFQGTIRQVEGKHPRERQAVYAATDDNYVRFECGGYTYECVNGNLHMV